MLQFRYKFVWNVVFQTLIKDKRMDTTNAPAKPREKDYSKLDAVFEAAVRRSRQKRITPYGSETLVTAQSKIERARALFKTEASAEPVKPEDVNTTVLDLNSGEEKETAEAPLLEEEEPLSAQAQEELAAIETAITAKDQEDHVFHKQLKEQVDDFFNTMQPPEKPKPAPDTYTPPESFDLGLLSEAPVAGAARPEAEPEAPEPTGAAPAREAEVQDAPKEKPFKRAALVFGLCAVVFIVYVCYSFTRFEGFDTIGLVLCLIGIFLAWDLSYQKLIISCALMLAVLVGCMIYTTYQTGTAPALLSYGWLIFIPLLASTSYSFFVNWQFERALKKKAHEKSEEKVFDDLTTPLDT